MAHRDLVLAGDIGGTKTNLALFSVHGDKLHSESLRTFPSKRYSGLVPVLQEFLAGDHNKLIRHVSASPAQWSTGKSKPPIFPG
jgi:glucokinase